MAVAKPVEVQVVQLDFCFSLLSRKLLNIWCRFARTMCRTGIVCVALAKIREIVVLTSFIDAGINPTAQRRLLTHN
jgi:hypothetical protein